MANITPKSNGTYLIRISCGSDASGKPIIKSKIFKPSKPNLSYGNICPSTDCRSTDKETKQLMGYIANHHDALLATLNNQQKELFEKFGDCYNELTDINEREIFTYAFKLGMMIAIEVLHN